MRVITARFCEGITGLLYKGCGYALRTYMGPDGKPIVRSMRTAVGSRSPDDRHLRFIETVARMAVEDGEMMVRDVRVSVRELARAYGESLLRPPDKMVEWMVAYVSLVLRRVKPKTELNARETLKIISALSRRAVNEKERRPNDT